MPQDRVIAQNRVPALQDVPNAKPEQGDHDDQQHRPRPPPTDAASATTTDATAKTPTMKNFSITTSLTRDDATHKAPPVAQPS